MPGNQEPVQRVAIVPDLDWPALVLLALLRPFGWRGYHLREEVRSRFALKLVASLGIQPVLLEELKHIPLTTESFDEPGRIALKNVESWAFPNFTLGDAAVHRSDGYSEDVLRIAMLKELTIRAPDAFAARLWFRSLNPEGRCLIASSQLDRYVVSDAKMPVRVIFWPLLLRRFIRKAKRLLRKLATSTENSNFLNTAESITPTNAVSSEQGRSDATAECIFVFNQGLQYGQLYAFDQWNHVDPESPLHPEAMAYLSPRGGQQIAGKVAHAFPTKQKTFKRTIQQLLVWTKVRRASTKATPWIVAWTTAGHLLLATQASKMLRQRFPAAKLAIYAFEIQVPPTLSLAFHLGGITTLATLERALIAEVAIAPFAVDTLVTPDEGIDQKIVRNRAITVRRTVPLGYWRVDTLLAARTKRPPESIQVARAAGMHPIVVLPYHLNHPKLRASDPIATSTQAIGSFLRDVLSMATAYPECYFIIRGKNANWMDDERMYEIVELIHRTANIEVDTEYSRLNQSYRLCAFADVIVAKHTALVDECLTIGIPCILHDFTPNSTGYAKSVLRYEPNDLWAESYGELLDRFDAALLNVKDRGPWQSPISAVEVGPRLRALANEILNSAPTAGVDGS